MQGTGVMFGQDLIHESTDVIHLGGAIELIA